VPIIPAPDSGHRCDVRSVDYCRIGANGMPEHDPDPKARATVPAFCPDGTIYECPDCGRTWVAHHPYINVLTADWRPEGRFERWRRERKARR
jgi:rRNA maturation protein Nop10